MVFAISKFIARLFGLDITKVQKAVLLMLICLGVIAVIVLGLWTKSCITKRTIKFDEKKIAAAQKAIAEQDRKEMVEILANSELAEKQIDANLANAGNTKLNTLLEARKRANQLTNEQLAAELERRINE